MAEVFPLAEDDYRENAAIKFSAPLVAATDCLFSSVTQAYREALVGCAIARIINQDIDIRLPATESGEDAFSGRSLADNAVTPFLRDRAIPISVSPYLSALRGGAKFIKGGAPRIQRDKDGFDALVDLVDYLRSGLADYLFITTTKPDDGAFAAARSYTGVGHEMNFVPLADWLVHNLATIGRTCRALFQAKMIELLSAQGTPAEIRVAWNDKMDEAIGVKAK
ncbi:MAG: hypothetical protein IVW56_03355 [Candidatus Binataceae bacterium]|nr:hypothetical protein [Candidatus Binataceae bacterium]